jgi:hypothetical protein
VPLLVFRNLYPEFITLTHYSVITSLNLIVLTLFYYNGTKSTGRGTSGQFFKHFPLFMVVYMGLSVQNAIAVLQGFFGKTSVFVRPPKAAITAAQNNTYLSKGFNGINSLEVAVFCYFFYGICLSIYLNDYFMMLFFVMITYGLGFILFHSVQLALPKNRLKTA